MTFVAQPYERFVDDLLVGLTGGTVREEHEFTGIDRAYTLGRPGVEPTSLRVFGQRDGAFAVFAHGTDFRYDATEQAIAWLRQDGRPPDDRTTFYVSYFTADGVGRLTDRNPGSVTTTLAEAFARQYGVLHRQMEQIYRSAFVETATGSSLDHVAALLDITRRDAKFAVGEVLFKRSTPAPGDIAIAVATLVSTADGQVFETTAPRTLRRDQLAVVVPVRARLEGPPGAVAAGAIAIMNRPVFGIEAVLNERPTFFAGERETDQELRRRIRGRLHRAGRSTVEALRASLIDGVPGLTEANVQVAEHPETPGYVDVRIGTPEGTDVKALDAAILQARPAGVRVRHNLSGALGPTPADRERRSRPEVVAALGAAGLPAAAADVGGTEAVLPLRVEVLLHLAEPNLTATEREAVETGVLDAVLAYVEALPMGEELVYAKLLARVAASDDVADASVLVTALTTDAPPLERYANVAAAGRKVTVKPDDVAVYLMDQHVRLDVRVRITGADSPPPTLEPALHDALEAAVAGRRRIARDELRAAVTLPPGFAFADEGPLVVNATYEETGRLVSDAGAIELAEHEVALIGQVVVEAIGDLDG